MRKHIFNATLLLTIISISLFHFLNIPGKLVILIALPCAVGILILSIGLIRFLYNRVLRIDFLILGVLYLLVAMKIMFTYYNVLISSTLTVLGIVYLLKKEASTKLPTTTPIIFLSLINVVLVFTSDTKILLLLNSGFTPWNSEIAWDDFKGEPLESTDENDAEIYTWINYKVNHAFNPTPAIAIALMDPEFSRKKLPQKNLTPELLQHEQYHFNLTERMKNLALDSVSPLNTAEENETIIRFFIERENQEQNQYDQLTMHGSDYEQQQAWETKFEGQ